MATSPRVYAIPSNTTFERTAFLTSLNRRLTVTTAWMTAKMRGVA